VRPRTTNCEICGACVPGDLRALEGWARCASCGVWYRCPCPSPEQLKAYYESEFRASYGLGDTSMHATSRMVARQYIAQADEALGGFDWRGSRILDYGAGEGDLSIVLSELGAYVTAVEPFGYEACGLRGVRTVRTLEELPPDTSFDGLFMTEVLEHLQRPIEVLRRLSGLLNVRGWVFVTTPNSESLKARLTGVRWEERQKFGHLYSFSPSALSIALKAAGFRATRCRGPVRFSNHAPRRVLHFALQLLALGGNLRTLGIKAG